MRILRANQVSPLQNWYPIIYIHNDMINSVRYVDLGEACLARKKHIITCSGASRHAVIEPCRMAVVVALAQCETLGETQSKTGITRKSCPLYLLAACHGAPLQSQCYLKMRNAHFTGESGFAPTRCYSIFMRIAMR